MSTTPDYRRLIALRQLAQQADAIIIDLPETPMTTPTMIRLRYTSADLLYLIDALETKVRDGNPPPNHGPWKRERVLPALTVGEDNDGHHD